MPFSTLSLLTQFHAANHEILHEDLDVLSYASGVYRTNQKNNYPPDFADPVLNMTNRFGIVDIVDGNILVRGSYPFTVPVSGDDARDSRVFAYTAINNEMKKRMKDFNGTDTFNLDDYEVVQFILHDHVGWNLTELTNELKNIGHLETEVHWPWNTSNPTYPHSWPDPNRVDDYKNNPDDYPWDPSVLYLTTSVQNTPSGLFFWPMYSCPGYLQDTSRSNSCDPNQTIVGLELLRFNEASAQIRNALTAPAVTPGKKRLIYFHCIQGRDRTPALHITYLLDRGWTFRDAVDRAWKGIQEGQTGADKAQIAYNNCTRPMCIYLSLAHQYCLSKYSAEICAMPDGFDSNPAYCLPKNYQCH